MKADLNKEIQRLKTEGKSLRAIATALGVSHVAVLKRLRAMEESRLVTSMGRERLPELIEGKDNEPACSVQHQSKLYYESKDDGNQLVTNIPPSSGMREAGNSSGSPMQTAHEGDKRVVSDQFDDLFEFIKTLLESQGIELCRMNVGSEAYQAKYKGQTIRFYVQRKYGESQVPGTG